MDKHDTDKPTASMEDYLEKISLLQKEEEPVSVTAISKAMGVKKPSVDWALKKLSHAGLVLHERYGDVELTDEGERIGRDVYRRHETLRRFLVDILGVSPEVAEIDACEMEHSLSGTGLTRLERFIDFVLDCPHGYPEWLKGYNYYVEHGERDAALLARCRRKDK